MTCDYDRSWSTWEATQVACGMLSSLGLEAETAVDGADALLKMEAERFDLVGRA